jgi:hypothetical protein
MANRHLFVPFTKIDEEKREVWGRLTHEVVDRDGEIWDYDASVPHMKAWSESFAAATDGQSLGNLRAMHQPISAGKLIAIEFNDAEKAVDIGTKIVDDKEWEKVQQWLYTGFSLGGRVVKSWRDPNEPKYKRFEVKPIEASLADMPCVPTATFTYIKVGGLSETRHFNKTKAERAMLTKFADAANRKFPIETKAQTQVSLAVWGKTKAREAYAEADQATIVDALVTAATEHALEGVTAKALEGGDFAKGLYDVSRLAELIQSLAYLQQNTACEREYEDDGSPVPDAIRDAIASLLGSLEAMVGEEGDELLRMLGLDAAAEANKTAAIPVEEVAKVEAPAPVDSVSVAGEPAAAAAAEASAPIGKVDGASDFAKALARKHVAALSDMADHVKAVHTMLGDHVEKMAGFCKDMSSAGSADDETTEKVAGAEYSKVLGERDTWQKRAESAETALAEATTARTAAEADRDEFKKKAEALAEAGDKLTAALEVRKGTLIAVAREHDGAAALAAPETASAGESTKEKKEKAELAPGEVDRPALHSEFKKAFRSPGLPLPPRPRTTAP